MHSSEHEALDATRQGDELESLLNGFLTTIITYIGALGGAARILSFDGRELHIAGAVGLPPELYEGERCVDLGCGVCGKAARDGAISSVIAEECATRSGLTFFRDACKCVVAVPLEFRSKRIGVLNLFFEHAKELDTEALRLLRSFADLIGISLENARLARENRRMNLMAERQAIANEIHDSLAHTLYYARMRMGVLPEVIKQDDAQRVEKCIQDVDEALESGQKTVRELITHFRCQMDPLGLQHALQVLVDNFRERTGIALEYTNRVADPGLPLEHELQVFNIVRELLANIGAHSEATRAKLIVSINNGMYLVDIHDNGIGMSSMAEPEGHYGLTIMRERARRIGAEIEMESIEAKGTRVRLSFAAP